ncbi:unnamed protein product, partial [Auanema sp. JU1783]
ESDRKNDLITTTTVPAILDTLESSNVEAGNKFEEITTPSSSPVSSISKKTEVYTANDEKLVESADSYDIVLNSDSPDTQFEQNEEHDFEETGLSISPVTEKMTSERSAESEQQDEESSSTIRDTKKDEENLNAQSITPELTTGQVNEQIHSLTESSNQSEQTTSHLIESSEYELPHSPKNVKDEIEMTHEQNVESDDSNEGFGDKAVNFAKKAGALAGAAVVAPVALAALGAQAADDAIQEHGQSIDFSEPDHEKSLLDEKNMEYSVEG